MMKILSEETIQCYIPEAEQVFLPENCHFDEKSEEFIKCLDSVDVIACPGSGKTTALLAKLYIMSKFMPFEENKGICVLTHTNVAIDEIKKRMGKASSILFTYPNFFGTIQSFVDKFLAIPAFVERYRHRDIEFDSDYAKHYMENRLKRGTRIWLSNQFDDIINNLILNDSNNICIKKSGKVVSLPISNTTPTYQDLDKVKKEMVNNGVLRYDESYLFAQRYINSHPLLIGTISSRFKYLLIDEMQDTDKTQMDIITRLFSQNSIIQRIGDTNQAIFNKVTSENSWDLNENQIHIPNSKRISVQIAKVIKNVCIKPENELQGVNRGTVDSLKPIMILYNDGSRRRVLEKYCELVSEREENWNQEIRLQGREPVYFAIGWTHDTEGLTSDNKEKTSVKSYFSDYQRPTKTNNPIYNSLKNYLVKQDDEKSQVNPKNVLDSLIRSFLSVLNQGEIRNPDTSKRFTKRALIKHLGKDGDFFPKFKENLAFWVKQIQNHACDNETCATKNKSYPECVLTEVTNYIKTDWTSHFGIDPAKIEEFLTNDLESVHEDVKFDNKYTHNEIDIHVGTVHSVKGQTHTATLFLECFSHDFNGKQLLDYLTENKTYKEKDGVNKNCALKIAYVAMSRPTHFLCAAFHKDRIPTAAYEKLRQVGWNIEEI
jgi:superfamily I DNA/RNA helicase